jgi:hypothetical protein
MRKRPGSAYDRWNISVKIPIGIQSPKSKADNAKAFSVLSIFLKGIYNYNIHNC